MTEIIRPPLQLDYYFIVESSVKANPDYEPTEEHELKSLKFNTIIIPELEMEDTYQLQMTVMVNPSDEEKCPYTIKVTVVAFFVFNEDQTEGETQIDILAKNGPTIIFSVIREHIMNITSRAPWGYFMLPLLSPVMLTENVKIAMHEETGEEKSAN